MRIVLIHGYKSSPRQNFWPWLSDALRERGHDVVAPELPNPAEPICQEWVDTIKKSIHRPAGDTVFIAHSLGCVALLHYLEQADMAGTPKAIILISAPFHIASERFASFFVPPVDFETVMWKGQEFILVHAKDDAVIPFDHAKRYEQELNGALKEIETGGHLMDVTELSILLDLIDDRNTVPGDSLHDDFSDIHVVL